MITEADLTMYGIFIFFIILVFFLLRPEYDPFYYQKQRDKYLRNRKK